jgi:hypothetical protein
MNSFKRGLNAKEVLRIGQIHHVDTWLDEHRISNAHIEKETDQDGSVKYAIDVEGDVYLKDFHLDDVAGIPDHIRFRNVKGGFILEKIPPCRIEPKPMESDGDSKMNLDMDIINQTREWLKKYRIENTLIERNKVGEGPVFWVDVDEDVVLWDMHINDVADMPDYFRFRHVNGRVILGNGNRKLFQKHLLLKAFIAMLEEDLKKRNLATAEVRARKWEDRLVADIRGNLVMKDYDFMINEIPVQLRHEAGNLTILSRLSMDEIHKRLKEHAVELITKYKSKNTDIEPRLSGLLSEGKEGLTDLPLFGFSEEPSSGYHAVRGQSLKRLAGEILTLSHEYGLPRQDQYGVHIEEYLDILHD